MLNQRRQFKINQPILILKTDSTSYSNLLSVSSLPISTDLHSADRHDGCISVKETSIFLYERQIKFRIIKSPWHW